MDKTILTFLSAGVPLTKRFEQDKEGNIAVHPYPAVKNVTSHTEEVSNLDEMYQVLVKNSTSKLKPSLIKGPLLRQLKKESRQNMCPPDTLSTYAVLDFDKAPFSSPNEAMKALHLEDVSYIWQFSSSSKVFAKEKRLSGHVFIMLNKAISPKMLRAWTMELNLRTEVLRKSLTLSNAKETLHWPVDICINDNSRLIYIAEPIFHGMQPPMLSKDRIVYVPKKLQLLDISRIGKYSIETLKKEQRDVCNELRIKEGLQPITPKIKIVDEHEVQTGVGECTTYEVIDDGGDYIRYNINGGDSQAYWHPRNNFQYIHSFKGGPSMLMKEVMPSRYKELVGVGKDQRRTPNTDGDLLLAFREKRTAEYWKGTWNESKCELDIHPVRSKDQLEDFMQGHGTTVGPYVPEWQLIFNPHSEVIVDEQAHIVNQFIVPPMLRKHKATKNTYPTIQKALDSAVGTGDIQEHFLNWLAVICQYRIKTQTAWIFHGTYGTGKGVIINHIMLPILTERYCGQIKASSLTHSFDGWKENKLLIMIDEVEVDIFEKTSMEGDLRNLITEPTCDIHRKGVNLYKIQSYINLIFGSNKPQPVKIPLGDRRFNVGKYQHKRWVPTQHEIEVLIPEELGAFAHYLMTRKADINLARTILQTEDRRAIQELGVTSVDEFAHDILEGNIKKLWEYMPDERAMNEHGTGKTSASAYASILKRFAMQEESKISRDELELMFIHAIGKVPEGAGKFTTFLRHHGIVTKKIWHGNVSTYGISVTWDATQEERNALVTSLHPVETRLRRAK